MAFGNRIMYAYALYAFAFSPQNPKDALTWINEGGDPVNFTKLVWENHNKEVSDDQGNPNPELISFYNQARFLSLLWNLLDINFYKEAAAFFGDELKGKKLFYTGNEHFQWSYGTLFNTSVLGVELYLNNYLNWKERFYHLYFKYGFPFKNYGLGLYFTGLSDLHGLSVDGIIDLWNQDIYGKGWAMGSDIRLKILKRMSLRAQIGYKSKGYLAGRTTAQGIYGFMGLSYHLSSSNPVP